MIGIVFKVIGIIKVVMSIKQLLRQLMMSTDPKDSYTDNINTGRIPRGEGDMESGIDQTCRRRLRDTNRFSILATMSSDDETPGTGTPDTISNLSSMITLFPLPYQQGAPYFDGRDVTRFLNRWEGLTFEWNDEKKIKKMVAYCTCGIWGDRYG